MPLAHIGGIIQVLVTLIHALIYILVFYCGLEVFDIYNI